VSWPAGLLERARRWPFRKQRRGSIRGAQALWRLLRHSLHEGIAEPLEAESLALTLVRRALAPRAMPRGRQALAASPRDRINCVLGMICRDR